MRKYIILGFLCISGLFVFSVVEYLNFYDGKLGITICDVGQGDGVVIKSPQGYVMLFDAGPDDAILSCLSSVMPFWQRDLDLVMISHPHADHFMGMFSIFPSYTIKTYASETLVNRSSSFKELQKKLAELGLKQRNFAKGDKIILPDGVRITVLGPSDEFLERASPTGDISDVKELVSLVVLIEYGNFSALLTGDSEVSGLEDAEVPDVVFLQVPHHGSASGLSEKILDRINPEIATISVGENKYGHPTTKILDLLQQDRVPTYRTDIAGNITLKTDGKKHFLKREKPD